ncbi:MAG: YdcF family protein [Lachnospiraceae bacterium]|nr:YdcF family protein [Lachnospiraceae bacterium]
MKRPNQETESGKKGKAGRVIFKILLAILGAAVAVLVLLAAVRLIVVLGGGQIYSSEAEIPKEEPYDAIIVPGASVRRDRTPSPILKNRLDKAESLFKAGAAKTILVTGDHRPGEYDETDVMWEYLVARNVPEENIVRDYKGFSTYESMMRAAEEYGFKRVLVVTQRYHLPRALYIGRAYGLEAYGIAAEDVGGRGGRLYRLVREWIASAKDFTYCLLKYKVE